MPSRWCGLVQLDAECAAVTSACDATESSAMGIFQLDATESVFGDMPYGNHTFEAVCIVVLRSLRLDPGEGLNCARKDLFCIYCFVPYGIGRGGGVC